jgi:hypothetical protein
MPVLEETELPPGCEDESAAIGVLTIDRTEYSSSTFPHTEAPTKAPWWPW